MALQHVLLVVVLCNVELSNRDNGGLDTAPFLLVLRGQGALRQSLLLLIMVEDGRHVLSSALGRGVMVLPEDVQQRPVVGAGWVVVHIHRLSVVAETAVGGVDLGAPREAHSGAYDSVGRSKLGFGEPESRHPEGGLLGGDVRLQQRHDGVHH